jgi:hypothetical protein
MGARGAAIALAVALIYPAAVRAAPENATARALIAAWKDQHPNGRLAAVLIAGAFASGFVWGGKIGGREVYCPPSSLGGRAIMRGIERFIAETPDMADKPYGVALAEPLRRAFPCQAS